MALGVFVGLCRVIVGGKRLNLLCQVRQLGILDSLHALFGFIVGSRGCGLLAQVVDLLCQRLQVSGTRLIRTGKRVGLLAQGVDLPLHGIEPLTLGRFFGLRCVVVGGKRLQLGFQSGQIVMGGTGVQLACQHLQGARARLVRAGECVGLLAQGSQLRLNGGNLLALRRFLRLRRCIIGGKGRGLLVQGLDLLRQGGQLGILGSVIVGRCEGSHLRLQGRELIGLFLIAASGFSVGVLQCCHAHLIGVPGGGVLAETLLDRDDVDHQENDNGEKGQCDGPVEQRFQEGRHLRIPFPLRHTCAPLRDEA